MGEPKTMRQVDGYYELLDEQGNVVHRTKDKRRKKQVQDPKALTTKEPPERKLHLVELADGTKALIPQGLSLDALPQEAWPFGEAWSQKICTGISEGKSLTSLCKQEGWPSIHTVYRWLRQNPAFASEYVEARKMQGDWAYDKVLQIAENPGDDAKIARLQADIMMWAAEVNDRKQYQRTTRHEAEIPALNITVVTGVPDPEPIEVPSWDPSKDPEHQQAEKESPVFAQAETLKRIL